MTARAHLARSSAPLPTTPLTGEELDALDARVRDDAGPAAGLAAVVSGLETLAALARAWPQCASELRGLRQRVDQLAREAEHREQECAALRQDLAVARQRLRALGHAP